jgi:uncharacterized integral membrane protein
MTRCCLRFLVCQEVDRSQRNERIFMMNHTFAEAFMMNQTGGWMGGWMGGWAGGGGMWVWTVVGVLVAVLLVILIMKQTKK